MKSFLRSPLSLFLAAVLSFILIAPGCSSTKPQPAAEAPVTLTVSAGASLKNALTEIQGLYTQEKSNVTINYNFGSSGSLQQQIEQGAPVDLFISAAAKQMNELEKKSLIDTTTRTDLVKNKVVLVAPKDSTLVGFEDLTSDKVKKLALGEPASVPAGQYANEVLSKIGIADKVKEKTVLAKDVRQVLTYVETGNAEAGVVYETDAKISDKVKIIAAAPEGSHSPVVYPAATIAASKSPKEAKAFLQYLKGDKAKAVFEKYGFTTR